MYKPYFYYMVIETDQELLMWSRDSRFGDKMVDWFYTLDSPHIYQECNSVLVF